MQNKTIHYRMILIAMLLLGWLLCAPLSPVAIASPPPVAQAVILTAAEQAWLRNHPVIRLAPDPGFAPIEYFDKNGQFKGASAEIIGLLEKKLGITISVVRTKNWDEAMSKLNSREVDLLGVLAKTPDWEKSLLFTDTILAAPGGIFTRSGTPANLTLKDLVGKKVAVVSNYASHNFLKNQYPEINLEVVPDILAGLTKVSLGRVDAYVESIALATYNAQQAGITNLQLAGKTEYDYRWSYVVRNDAPELHSILNKGLATISDEERQQIINRYIHVQRLFWRPGKNLVIGAAVLSVGALLLFFLYWNRSLRRQVHIRTVSLQQELAERQKAEAALKELTCQLEQKVIERTAELQREIDKGVASEEALEKLVHEQRIIFDCASVGICFLKNRKLQWGNPTLGRIFGYPAEMPLNTDTVEWYADDKAYIVIGEQAYSVIQTGEIYSNDVQMKRRDGSLFWCTLTGQAVTPGKPGDGSIWILQDISKRKQAENRLRESDNRYSTLLNTIPDLIWLKDTDGVYLSCNSMFERFFGAREADIVGKTDYDFVDKELADFFREHDRKAMAANHPSSNEEWITFADNGQRVLLYTTKTPMRDSNGALIGVLGVGRDITEIMKAEETLRKSEEFSRRIIESSSDCIKVLDLEGHLQSMSDGGLKLLEIDDLTPFLGLSWIDFWKDDREGAQRVVAQAASGEVGVFHGFCKTIKGTPKWWDVVVSPIFDADNNVENLLAVSRDVTGRKLAEEDRAKLESQLHQAQKMESIGSLAGGVAHDFNNKLSVILGCTHLAFTEEDPVKLHHFLEEISKAAEQSADLTRQLLAFARKQTISPKVLDLNETISGMIKMLQRLIGENVRLAWHPAPSLWQIKADPSQIDQILANLCVNARDAIRDTGRITIETRDSNIDTDYCDNNPEATPGEYVQLSVSDNGSGMDKETMAHIYEPFFTTKGLGEGTGLGLATVYGIVKQNNGFITIYSEPGQGTTFSIHLPRYVGTSVQNQKDDMAIPAPIGSETILLVEDELAILTMASMMLGKQGYKVLSAHTPTEAIRLAKENSGEVSLLITDVIMPETNGKELTQKLQLLCPQLKYLYMSGYTADAIAQHGVLDEGVNFIQKPFTVTAFVTKVREVLDTAKVSYE